VGSGEKPPLGFVALQALKQGRLDPTAALAAIRRIYFTTTQRTIEHDLAHAIELLKTLDSEDDRDRAAVYMDGLAQMRSEWARAAKARTTSRKRPSSGR
jgi:hypothetical protein